MFLFYFPGCYLLKEKDFYCNLLCNIVISMTTLMKWFGFLLIFIFLNWVSKNKLHHLLSRACSKSFFAVALSYIMWDISTFSRIVHSFYVEVCFWWSVNAAVPLCSVKKLLLKISQNSQENTCVGAFLKKLNIQLATLIKKRFLYSVFLWILRNF